MKILKSKAIELIDRKISEFEGIYGRGPGQILHNGEYKRIYKGAEHLVAELFSEDEMLKFRRGVTNPYRVVRERTFAEELGEYQEHVESCIAYLKAYKERIENFWPDDKAETKKRMQEYQETIMDVSEGPEYFKYDIAISYAGENREIAEDLAKTLSDKGVRVFYDLYYKSELWGKNLEKYFREAYGSKTRFVVILISKYYPAKDWADLEFRIARDEATKRMTEFILPVRLDDTKILGIHEDVAYLDYRREGTKGIANSLLEKLSKFPKEDREIRIDSTVNSLLEKSSELLKKGEEIRIEGITDRYSERLLKFLGRKKSWTTFTELEEGLGLSRRVVRGLVHDLEKQGYVTVSKENLGRVLIVVDSKLFFGEHMKKKIEECLLNLTTDASKYGIIREVVRSLPEDAVAHFEDADLWGATKIYNEAVERLAKAGIERFPLVQLKSMAPKISLGPNLI